MRIGISLAIAALCAALGAAGAVAAQATSDVRFAAGTSGATINGTITGDEYIDYRLGAKAGQKMKVALKVRNSKGTGTPYFNILPPKSTGEAIYIGSTEGNSAQVTLPAKGTYTIRVYQMGAAADEGISTDFRIDVSIK